MYVRGGPNSSIWKNSDCLVSACAGAILLMMIIAVVVKFARSNRDYGRYNLQKKNVIATAKNAKSNTLPKGRHGHV